MRRVIFPLLTAAAAIVVWGLSSVPRSVPRTTDQSATGSSAGLVAEATGSTGAEAGLSASPGADWALLPGEGGGVVLRAAGSGVVPGAGGSAAPGAAGSTGAGVGGSAAAGAGGSTAAGVGGSAAPGNGQGAAPGQAVASAPPVTTPPVAVQSQPSAPPVTTGATGPFAPNRLGQIPVLEFHNFGDKDGRWSLSWGRFQEVIQTLYNEGFRPVNLVDVVDRKIDLPRGFAPVVITFDDGDPAQFQWGPQGSAGDPAQQSAVGILHAFHQAHPDWGDRATFFVNDPAFGGDSEAKLRWLVSHGFEVGDHTLDHVPLRQLNAAQVLHQVGGLAAWVQQIIPGYHVATLAFPDGIAESLPDTAWAGTVNGQSYAISAAVLVGAGPAPSPYSQNWNARAIPRIQVVNPALVSDSDRNFIWASWEKRLLAHPEQLYVSDGAAEAATASQVAVPGQAALPGQPAPSAGQ